MEFARRKSTKMASKRVNQKIKEPVYIDCAPMTIGSVKGIKRLLILSDL